MRLFSYKITHDSGFAPNPFGQALTLATCKPGIRRTKREGDWVAGFTSKALDGSKVGEEMLVFLMKVGRRMTFEQYFNDKKFQSKIPKASASSAVTRAGDNIYKPLCRNASTADDFEQLPNPHHCSGFKEKDLSGQYILIADDFWYFGKEALVLPNHVRPKVPFGPANYGVRTDQGAATFINYIKDGWSRGRHGDPHQWPPASVSGCGSSCV